MQGLNVAMQLECDCGEIIEIEHSSTKGNSLLPMLRQFEKKCVCGRVYFTHVQECKPNDK